MLEVSVGATGEQCWAGSLGSRTWGLCFQCAKGLHSPNRKGLISCMPGHAPSLPVAQVVVLISWLEHRSKLL